jgi:hypothetical protein
LLYHMPRDNMADRHWLQLSILTMLQDMIIIPTAMLIAEHPRARLLGPASPPTRPRLATRQCKVSLPGRITRTASVVLTERQA